MKILLTLGPVLFLGLASAAPPPGAGPEREGTGYPPCSATVTDRCIQLHERGVRSRDNLAINAGEAAPMSEPVQVSGGDYPPCTAARQDRCTQSVHGRHAPAVHYAMAERERIRIGERG